MYKQNRSLVFFQIILGAMFYLNGLSLNISSAQIPEGNKNGQLSDILNNLLKLTVTGNSYSDQTIVVFVPGSTPGFDPEYDAYKLQGIPQAPQLYSIIPGNNLAINALPEILINLEVQLGFQVGALNTYTITASDLSSFDPAMTIFLDDTKDNVITDLVLNPVYSFTANPGDNIERFRLLFRYPVYLDLKVFLEGPFNGTGMNTDLTSMSDFPMQQPYNSSPWNYAGTENVTSIPSNVVDWVLIEIRDTTTAGDASLATRTERAAGFLLNDGSVKGLDGTSMLRFTETISDSLFVIVWHRNHLGIISAHPVVETSGIYSYDFSISSDQGLGDTLALKNLGEGVFGMFAGDMNADGVIDENDKSDSWSLNAGNAGYLNSDIDLNGQSDNPDKNDIWLENQADSCQVPQ
jgi:hypothetical protein